MKLTKQYAIIISDWWAQLLMDNKNLRLTETTIECFKTNLMHFLNVLDYEAGQLFHARVNSLEFLPHNNPLSLALTSAIRTIGLAPNVFPYGAELRISESYEICVCADYTKKSVRLALSDTVCVDSFDSSSDSLPAKSTAKLGNSSMVTNTTCNDDAEYSLDGSSFLIDSSAISPASFESRTSALELAEKSSYLLKRNGLFNTVASSSTTFMNKRQRLENNNSQCRNTI